MINCAACSHGQAPCLHHVPIFAHLEPEQIRQVQQLIIQRQLSAGQVLFREGDACQSLYIVRSGSLKLVRYGSDGKEYLLDTLFPGDFYGSNQLLGMGEVRETGIAEQEASICTINGEDLRKLLLSRPEIGVKMMLYLNSKLEQYRLQLEMLSTKDVEKRICMYLSERARKTGSLSLILSQEDIGNAIHLTKETVNRKLSILQDEGLVEVSGKKKITILDLGLLKQRAFF
jgi:CRP/FNR family transcriptional regulator